MSGDNNGSQSNLWNYMQEYEAAPFRPLAEYDKTISEQSSTSLLRSYWSFWFYEPKARRKWTQNLKELGTFNTIEGFWSHFHALKRASDLPLGCDYAVFKQGIKPMWEDVANLYGGRWVLMLDNAERFSRLNKTWLDTILCVLNEDYEYAQNVCGVAVNVRGRGDKISFWTMDGSRENIVLTLGNFYKKTLGFTEPLRYQLHHDAMHQNGPLRKYIHVV